MTQRTDRVNELLKSELANLITRNLAAIDYLITIIYVKCSPDLRYGLVGVSVLPENFSGTALKSLRRNSKSFRQTLKKKLNLKFIPKFNWIIDSDERNAIEIEEILSKINS